MVEVRAVHHVGVLELRIDALDHAHHVVGDLLAHHLEGVVDVHRHLRVDRERRRGLALVGLRLEVGDVGIVTLLAAADRKSVV